MTFDLQQIIESKRARRRALAQRPVAEKLAMLEALRDRTRTLRAAASRSAATGVSKPVPESGREHRKG